MTIKDLAARTGYAVGTVSRALNDHPNVSEKARRAILEAARESGFQLNANAKLLKQQRFMTILVVVKGRRNELFGDLLEVIQNLITKTPYQLVVDYMDEELNEVRQAVQLIREKKPLGVLFLGGNEQHFRQDFSGIDIPCVLVTGNASALDFPNLSSVSTDDREAARGAAEALIALGHRRIAVIGGSRLHSDTSRLRLEGCMEALERHGLPFDLERDYEESRYSYQDGYRAIHSLMERSRDFTAIFAIADVVAIGAIRALWEKGLRVPEDVAVMGLDGLPMGDFMVPQLATVSQSVQQIACRSVEILLSGIEEGETACHEIIPFSVQYRESICKAN